jgi:hypothetical protein
MSVRKQLTMFVLFDCSSLRTPVGRAQCQPGSMHPVSPRLTAASPMSAMAGNLVSSLPWGQPPPGMVPLTAIDGAPPCLRGGTSRKRQSQDSGPASFKSRKSTSELFNSRATHFASLTPWNKIELLNEIAPESFGMVYMSDASLDELDSAILIGTGMSPHDRVMFKDKQTQWQAPG